MKIFPPVSGIRTDIYDSNYALVYVDTLDGGMWMKVRSDIDIDRERDKEMTLNQNKQELLRAAQENYNQANARFLAANKEYTEATRARTEAQQVLNWVLAMPASVQAAPLPRVEWTKTAVAPELFFFTSKSGQTRGHFIRRFSDGTLNCSCPGFRARGYCWASNKVKSGVTINWMNRYKFSPSQFDQSFNDAVAANPIS